MWISGGGPFKPRAIQFTMNQLAKRKVGVGGISLRPPSIFRVANPRGIAPITAGFIFLGRAEMGRAQISRGTVAKNAVLRTAPTGEDVRHHIHPPYTETRVSGLHFPGVVEVVLHDGSMAAAFDAL